MQLIPFLRGETGELFPECSMFWELRPTLPLGLIRSNDDKCVMMTCTTQPSLHPPKMYGIGHSILRKPLMINKCIDLSHSIGDFEGYHQHMIRQKHVLPCRGWVPSVPGVKPFGFVCINKKFWAPNVYNDFLPG